MMIPHKMFSPVKHNTGLCAEFTVNETIQWSQHTTINETLLYSVQNDGCLKSPPIP